MWSCSFSLLKMPQFSSFPLQAEVLGVSVGRPMPATMLFLGKASSALVESFYSFVLQKYVDLNLLLTPTFPFSSLL